MSCARPRKESSTRAIFGDDLSRFGAAVALGCMGGGLELVSDAELSGPPSGAAADLSSSFPDTVADPLVRPVAVGGVPVTADGVLSAASLTIACLMRSPPLGG